MRFLAEASRSVAGIPMKVHLRTLGCRLNQSEIDQMARQFTQQGHEVTEDASSAELMVVNTCAVTQEATRSSRQLIYRLNRANPAAKIVVTGCYAHLAPADVVKLAGVTQVIDNFDKAGLVSTVTGNLVAEPELHDQEPMSRAALTGALGKTRAFIKVQDGCDRHCSFCVTKIARGAGRSRDRREIIDEINQLAALGYHEAVLTGVHLGSYGQDLGEQDGLHQLVATLLAETAMPRLRLSSLEPWGITPAFFTLWENPRLGKHLHLPLQSGCDATLRRMIRRTSQAEFGALVAAARQVVPTMAITSDVIVGFPGETDEEYAISRDFIESLAFAGMHIFRYSPRAGTAAVKLPDHVSEAVKHQRSDDLHSLALKAEQTFAERYLGTAAPVLWEAISGSTEQGFINNGYTDHFIRVQSIVPRVLTDTITPATLVRWDAAARVMQATLAD